MFYLDNNESVSDGSTEDIDYAPMPPESALFIFSTTNMWVELICWKDYRMRCLFVRRVNVQIYTSTFSTNQKQL